jgi:hypothetical protein
LPIVRLNEGHGYYEICTPYLGCRKYKESMPFEI